MLIYSFISFYKHFAKCLELQVQGIQEKYNVVSALKKVLLVTVTAKAAENYHDEGNTSLNPYVEACKEERQKL